MVKAKEINIKTVALPTPPNVFDDDHHPSGQEGRLFEKDSPHRRGNVDSQVTAQGREEPITF